DRPEGPTDLGPLIVRGDRHVVLEAAEGQQHGEADARVDPLDVAVGEAELDDVVGVAAAEQPPAGLVGGVRVGARAEAGVGEAAAPAGGGDPVGEAAAAAPVDEAAGDLAEHQGVAGAVGHLGQAVVGVVTQQTLVNVVGGVIAALAGHGQVVAAAHDHPAGVRGKQVGPIAVAGVGAGGGVYRCVRDA